MHAELLVVGLLLAESEFRHEIEVNIEPFKGLLLGLFFMSVGMGLDLATVLGDPLWITLSIIGLLAIKAVVVMLLARAFRFSRGESVSTGPRQRWGKILAASRRAVLANSSRPHWASRTSVPPS